MTKISTIIIAIALIAVIIFALVNLTPRSETIKKQNEDQSAAENKQDLTITITPFISNSAITDNPKKYPGTVEFTSADLGIAFNYLASANGGQFKTLEANNKVYIYESKLSAQSGQFVEVFDKPQDQSLMDAIRIQFLAGKSDKDCWVVDTTENYKNYPATYKIAEITFPKPADSQEPWWGRGDACSSDYAQTNGIRYFLGDTNHPDKFLFFDIGQYSIIAGEDLTWQDTIRFLD